MNEQNLIQNKIVNSRRTREKHVEDSKKGGIKSGQVRREKRMIKDVLKSFLSSSIKDKEAKKELIEMGFEDNEINNQTRIIAGLYNRAMLGDVKAFEVIRDTIGEKPADKIEITKTPKIVDNIPGNTEKEG